MKLFGLYFCCLSFKLCQSFIVTQKSRVGCCIFLYFVILTHVFVRNFYFIKFYVDFRNYKHYLVCENTKNANHFKVVKKPFWSPVWTILLLSNTCKIPCLHENESCRLDDGIYLCTTWYPVIFVLISDFHWIWNCINLHFPVNSSYCKNWLCKQFWKGCKQTLSHVDRMVQGWTP